MTINEYLNSLPTATNDDERKILDCMKDAVSIWSNDSCRGYCLDAMNRAGVSKKIQEEILRAMWISFDLVSIDEAACIGKEG